MPIEIRAGQPILCVRRDAFERSGLSRSALDARFSLTPEEFRVERDLIVIGPLYGDSTSEMIAELESHGLAHYDDFFDLSGNWPEWLILYAMRTR